MQGAQPKPRVLAVDDEPELLDIYGSVLREAGYAVELAPNLQTARDLLAQNGFDLVISDISLPDGTGIDVLRMVRDRSLDLPVVLVTGAPALDTAIRAIELGAMRYFVKPLRSEDLLRVAGIGPKKLARLAPLLDFAIGLNAKPHDATSPGCSLQVPP